VGGPLAPTVYSIPLQHALYALIYHL
jgi:hypothetical protein